MTEADETDCEGKSEMQAPVAQLVQLETSAL